MGRFEVLPHNGKARPDAPNIVFHRLDGRRKPWHLGLFFRGDAGAMIGEADGVPFVENGDHYLFEARMDEIFGNLPNNGVRDGPPCTVGLFVNRGGERLDISRRVGGFYLPKPVVRCAGRRRERCAPRCRRRNSRRKPPGELRREEKYVVPWFPRSFRFVRRSIRCFKNFSGYCNVFHHFTKVSTCAFHNQW